MNSDFDFAQMTADLSERLGTPVSVEVVGDHVRVYKRVAADMVLADVPHKALLVVPDPGGLLAVKASDAEANPPYILFLRRES